MKKFQYRKYQLIVIFLASFLFIVQAQNGWTLKSYLPTPRAGASATVLDNKIYVMGGVTQAPDFTNLAVNEVYEPLTNAWDTLQPMPTARGFLFTDVVNNIIYAIIGGYRAPTNKNEAYDPATNSWTEKANMLYPWAGIFGGVIDDKIYLAGGNYDQQKCFMFDPDSNTWAEKTPIPINGCKGTLSATVYNGLVYTFGGSRNYPNDPLSTVNVYNPQTDTWDTNLAHMPTPRYALRTFLVNDKIYAIGGCQSRGSSLATVEVYDPVTDSWETKPNMPFKISWFTGAVFNNKIYLFGGTDDWLGGDGAVWEYDPFFHTDILGGNVSGTWTLANSPYHILGEITIPNGETLTIEPGVKVVFMGHYKFNVQGRLLAIGTQQDSIRFTAENKEVGWHSIRFTNTPNTNDTSKFCYCSFKYGNANTGSGLDRSGGAMMISYFNKVQVSNCLFDSNKQSGEGWDPPEADGGIFIYYASSKITNSTFSNNIGSKSSAIGCVYSPNSIISNNVFFNNSGKYGAIAFAYNSGGELSGNLIYNNFATEAAGGILIDNGATPMVTNNLIIHNQGVCGGVLSYKSANPILINNTIVYNNGSVGGGGIAIRENAGAILINNILYGNTGPDGSQVNLYDASADPVFVYCNIQGGKEEFGGSGAGGNYSGLYENNIDTIPYFLDVNGDDYRLSDYSPCIGAGIDSIEIESEWYYAPPICYLGGLRPNPSGTMPDIGACESPLGTSGVEDENNLPTECALEQNYPNPFNPSTSIQYAVSNRQFVTLKIFNTLGEEIETLVNEEKPVGTYEVNWNTTNHSSGVFFYQLKAGSFVQTKKMILLK